MLSSKKIFRTVLVLGASLVVWTGSSRAQEGTAASPYGASAPEAAGGAADAAQAPGAGVPSGIPDAGTAAPIDTAPAGAAVPDATASAGMDPTAGAAEPARRGPNPNWLAEQNRASARLREEQIAKMNQAPAPSEQPAPGNPPAAQ